MSATCPKCFRIKQKQKTKHQKICVEKVREGGKMNDKTNKCGNMLTFGESGKRIYTNFYILFCESSIILKLFKIKSFKNRRRGALPSSLQS